MGPNVSSYEALWGAAGLAFALGGAAALARAARAADAPVTIGLRLAPLLAVAVAVPGARLHAMMASPAHAWSLLQRGGLDAALRTPGLRIGGGLVLAGGFLLVCVPWATRRRMSAVRALDELAPIAGASIAVGRLGCFLAGCCFGVPADARWAVRYPPGSPAYWNHVAQGLIADDARSWSGAVHPLSLYLGAAAGLASVAALAARRRRRDEAGWASLVFVAVLTASRWILEPLRETRFVGAVPGQGALDGAFLAAALFGLTLLALRRRRQPPTAANGPTSSSPGTPRRWMRRATSPSS